MDDCSPIDTPTSGGSSDSETRDPTVIPNRCPSTATVTTATPAGKRRMAARSSSPRATGRSYGRPCGALDREVAAGERLGGGRIAARLAQVAEGGIDGPAVPAGRQAILHAA